MTENVPSDALRGLNEPSHSRPSKEADPAGGLARALGSRVAIAVGLVLLTALVYGQTSFFPFVDWDDDRYVFANRIVLGGFDRHTLHWAFTTFDLFNWHPLTWLALTAEVTLLGPRAGAFHLVGATLHALNSVLLFVALDRLTGLRGRSAVVAALFCVHPVHVESVAWISEQKDTLSTLFGLLSLWCWAGWANGRSRARWLGAWLAFAASLLCKPMFVTWPFALLLLDLWPLGRLRAGLATRGRWRSLLGEKAPFLALSLASSLLTLRAQAGAMMPIRVLGLTDRVGMALDNYARYLGLLAWPTDLVFVYSIEPGFLGLRAVAAAVLLCALTVLAARIVRREPALLVGWLWFLGTLVPVIGLVQVGTQSIADRYLYLPSIGPLVAVAWGLAGLARRLDRERALQVAALVVVLTLAALAHRQAGYWRDSEVLFRHAVEATADNPGAMRQLGAYLLRQKRDPAEAAALLERTIQLRPEDADARADLGVALHRLGRPGEALAELQRAHALAPERASIRLNLARTLQKAGRIGEAIALLETGDSTDVAMRWALAQALEAAGRCSAAQSLYREVEKSATGSPLAEQARQAAARLSCATLGPLRGGSPPE